jgi:hypothetical protein
VNNTIFRDYEENNQYNEWIYQTLTDYINHQEIIPYSEDNKSYPVHKKEYFGSYFYSATLIKMYDGSHKPINIIQIGDILWNNNPVLAKITGNPHYNNWYIYNGDLVTGNTLVCGDSHKLVKDKLISRRILYGQYENFDQSTLSMCYSLITENNRIETNNNMYFDFEITRNSIIQEYIDSIVHSE